MTTAAIEGYLHFLETRDGEVDIYRETLSGRESFYRDIEAKPVHSRHEFDREAFLRNVTRSGIEPTLDARMAWIIATAKANQSERFGVELTKLYGRINLEGEDRPEGIHVVLQETYHTRVLADVVSIFGLPVPHCPPGPRIRFLIKLLVFSPFPKSFTMPLVGMSEMMGCVMFAALRDRGIALFADEPDVAERIRVLFNEILADEICHVGLVDAGLGRFGRTVMRGLYRLVGRRMALGTPEFVAAIGREEILRRLAEPFDQRSLAAQFPETAYPF